MRLQRRATRCASVALALALVLGVAACGEDDPVAGAEDGQQETAADEVPDSTIEDLQESPDAALEDAGVEDLTYGTDIEELDDVGIYDGQQVAISGTVGELVGEYGFTVTGGSADPLLVLTDRKVPGIGTGDEVRVTGTARAGLVLSAAEDELGVQLDDEMLAPYEREPYVLGGAVATAEGGGS